MRRTVAVTSLALGVFAAGTVPALAAPVKNHSPNAGDVFTLSCTDGRLVTVTTPPNDANFTPGFVVGTGEVLIPYSFTFTVTIGGVTDTDTMAKRAPVPSSAVTCTFGEAFVTPDGTPGTFSVSVTLVSRGAR